MPEEIECPFCEEVFEGDGISGECPKCESTYGLEYIDAYEGLTCRDWDQSEKSKTQEGS
jgi:hypothetical protein